MNLGENFRIAMRALSANKLRSGLTMLGIIIGVGAVVALMSIGNGATASITSQVQGIGSNLVIVFPGTQDRQRGGFTPANMYYSDYQVLERNLTDVVAVAPSFTGSVDDITYGKNRSNVGITATTPAFLTVRAYEVEFGRFITEQDRSTQARVVVIGSQTASDLFGGLNPVGRSIKMGGIEFNVIGVFKSKGASGFSNADDVLVIPLETGYAKFFGNATANGKHVVSDISLSAANPDVVNDVIVQIERLLRREHHLKLSDDLDFTVLSQSQFLSALGAITATLTAFLGFIGVISLVVGGIGVMNIMLVSVTERTREIGLRKAVGAKRNAILLQFLMETLVLSFIGGVLGVLLGWGISALVNLTGQVAAVVDAGTITVAFIVTALVGVFAGLYPAWRASRLRPIEALRYE